MSRQRPTPSTIRALFAKSGNVCAFPECEHTLVEDDNLYVGATCHIESAARHGPRYNSDSTDEERRSYSNLILLCHAHHRRIDSDVETYTADYLRRVKAEHEALAGGRFNVDSDVISQVEREMESYWSTLRTRQRLHPVPDLAVQIQPGKGGVMIFEDLRAKTRDVEDLLERYRLSDARIPNELKQFLRELGYDLTRLESVPYYENPFENRNWELHNLGSTNTLLDLQTLQIQAELLYLKEYEKHHSGATAATRRKAAMKELADMASSAAYTD